MGFSFSSTVAQETTLGIAVAAGIEESCIICDSEELPGTMDELAVVATDDTIVLHTDASAAERRLEAFDEAMANFGIPKAADKDINVASQLVGLGCLLTACPPRVFPEANKVWRLGLAIAGMDMGLQVSPKGFNGQLGVAQWFCILSRPHFSCFTDIYSFVRREPATLREIVPLDARNDLMLFLTLSPLLPVALDRPWLPLLTACDAAPEMEVLISWV